MTPLIRKGLYHGGFAALGIALIFGILLLQTYTPSETSNSRKAWTTQLQDPISAPRR